MKLLYCMRCNTLFNLTLNLKECECGAARGKYEGDGVYATYTEGVAIAIHNGSFDEALKEIRSINGREAAYFTTCIVSR